MAKGKRKAVGEGEEGSGEGQRDGAVEGKVQGMGRARWRQW